MENMHIIPLHSLTIPWISYCIRTQRISFCVTALLLHNPIYNNWFLSRPYQWTLCFLYFAIIKQGRFTDMHVNLNKKFLEGNVPVKVFWLRKGFDIFKVYCFQIWGIHQLLQIYQFIPFQPEMNKHLLSYTFINTACIQMSLTWPN